MENRTRETEGSQDDYCGRVFNIFPPAYSIVVDLNDCVSNERGQKELRAVIFA